MTKAGSAGQGSHDSPLINLALVNIDAAWPGWCWLVLANPSQPYNSGVRGPGPGLATHYYHPPDNNMSTQAFSE